jgi:hypothetical protein
MYVYIYMYIVYTGIYMTCLQIFSLLPCYRALMKLALHIYQLHVYIRKHTNTNSLPQTHTNTNIHTHTHDENTRYTYINIYSRVMP